MQGRSTPCSAELVAKRLHSHFSLSRIVSFWRSMWLRRTVQLRRAMRLFPSSGGLPRLKCHKREGDFCMGLDGTSDVVGVKDEENWGQN